MDWRKVLRLVGSPENFVSSFPSKRKLINAFRACVIASLLVVSMFFFKYPSQMVLLNPVLHGFNGIINKPPPVFPCNGVPLPNVSDSPLLLKKQNQADLSVTENTHQISLDSIGEKRVTEKSHEENFSEKTCFFVNSTGKDTQETGDNFSDSGKDSRFSSEEVRQQESVTSQDNNETSSGEKTASPVNAHNEESTEASGNNSVELGTDENNVGSVFGDEEASDSTTRIVDYSKTCDIFDGRWVRDEEKPYYPAGSCPYIDRDFDCHLNGRPDDDFLRWRWQPNQCNIPRLNATDFLERLRGKRLVFVGDSLNRNMWESMVCILRDSVPDKKRVYEITGKKQFKKKGFYALRFEDYDCTVDFVATTFLVRESSFNTTTGSSNTLRLDVMDHTTSMYRDADIIVFNSGHWWTHEKTSKGENYYQEGNYVYPKLEPEEAYRRALTTWARWIENNINVTKTQVFFRGYSLTHFSGGQWNSGGRCHTETEPILDDSYLSKYPLKMQILEQVLDQMNSPVMYMNISKLTDYRKDAHPSIYRKEYKSVEERIAAVKSQDCSHWCLPGVPDTWNELLYAHLLRIGKGSWRV